MGMLMVTAESGKNVPGALLKPWVSRGVLDRWGRFLGFCISVAFTQFILICFCCALFAMLYLLSLVILNFLCKVLFYCSLIDWCNHPSHTNPSVYFSHWAFQVTFSAFEQGASAFLFCLVFFHRPTYGEIALDQIKNYASQSWSLLFGEIPGSMVSAIRKSVMTNLNHMCLTTLQPWHSLSCATVNHCLQIWEWMRSEVLNPTCRLNCLWLLL